MQDWSEKVNGVGFPRQDFAQAEAISDFLKRPTLEVDAGTGYWMYTAVNDIPAGTTPQIKASVSDRPGNIVEASEEKAL